MRIFVLTIVVVVHLTVVWVLVRYTSPSEALVSPPPVTRETSTAGSAAGADPAPAAGYSCTYTPLPVQNLPLPAELETAVDVCDTGILVDWSARKILWCRQEKRAVPIASLTKMMTVLLLVEKIHRNPEITLESRVQGTARAWRIGGSEVYLDPRETFTLDELLKCILIHSANDAAHLVAEYLGHGDPAAFVSRMNARAAELGLSSLSFRNAHGLPPSAGQTENIGNAHDLACLAGHLLQYEEVVRWSSEWLSHIRKSDTPPVKLAERKLVNRNALVKQCPGVNGMKTGYTRKAGFCTAVTCVRQGRAMVVTLTGCPTAAQRNDLAAALLDWGYSR